MHCLSLRLFFEYLVMRTTVAIIALTLLCKAASAQFVSIFDKDESDKGHTFFGGLACGANFSQVDGDGFEGYHHVGLHAGPLVYVRIKGSLFASMELLYAQKGSKARYITESSSLGPMVQGYDLKLNYVEIPVLAHYIYRRRWAFGAGASYGRLLKSNESAFTDFPVNLHPEINYFHKDEWAGIAQLSYEFYRGWLVTMRYSYSLHSIRDGNRIPQGYGGGYFAGQYNNLWTLRLVYFFRGKTSDKE